MRSNNEFNKVKINNERGGAVEFVATQKAEATFYAENKVGYKDELNSRKVNNDVIEANVLHKDKKLGGLKQDYKKMKHGPIHLASSAGHAVVAATTVSVVVVAASVGMTVIVGEQKELITFVESSVGMTSLDFSFLCPVTLLSYSMEGGEAPGEGTVNPDYYTTIATSIFNSALMDEPETHEMEAGEMYDEENYIFYDYYSSLVPNTGYELKVYLETYYYETPEYPEGYTITKDLATRTIMTESSFVEWEGLYPDVHEVSFSYIVPEDRLDLDADGMPIGRYIDAVIYNNDTGHYESSVVGPYSHIGNGKVVTYYTFADLSPNTIYYLDLFYCTESLYENIFSTSFYTNEAEYGFDQIIFSENASYYNHTFDVKLLYRDDPDDPVYSDFVLNLLDSDSTLLQEFELEAIEDEPQTLTVNSQVIPTSTEPVFDYDLDQVFQYQLYAYDATQSSTVLLASGDGLTFNDSDVSAVYGFDSATPFTVTQQESLGKMPVKLDMIDESHIFDSFYVEITYTDIPGYADDVVFYGWLYPNTDWQYFEFNNDEGISVDMVYGYEGSLLMTYGEEITAYEDTITVTSCGEAHIYGGKVTKTELSSSDTDMQITIVYSNSYEIEFANGGPDTPQSPQIILVDEETGGEWVYVCPVNYYPSGSYSLSMFSPYSFPSGITLEDYNDLKDAMDGHSYTVYFRYQTYNTTTTETSEYNYVTISEGFSFTFTD